MVSRTGSSIGRPRSSLSPKKDAPRSSSITAAWAEQRCDHAREHGHRYPRRQRPAKDVAARRYAGLCARLFTGKRSAGGCREPAQPEPCRHHPVPTVFLIARRCRWGHHSPAGTVAAGSLADSTDTALLPAPLLIVHTAADLTASARDGQRSRGRCKDAVPLSRVTRHSGGPRT